MSEDPVTHGDAAMNAISVEAAAVLAFMEDVRKMRGLQAKLGNHPDLLAESKALNAQIAVSLQRQRRILQSIIDRDEGTAADQEVAREYIALIASAQAELKVGVFEPVRP
jgi:hypothetical protein